MLNKYYSKYEEGKVNIQVKYEYEAKEQTNGTCKQSFFDEVGFLNTLF